MQATPTDLFTLISATPPWFWLIPSAFGGVYIMRLISLAKNQSKNDESVFSQNVALMAEVKKLTSHKAQLVAWSSKAIRHFGGCNGCVLLKQEASRDELEDEYNQMMKDMQ